MKSLVFSLKKILQVKDTSSVTKLMRNSANISPQDT